MTRLLTIAVLMLVACSGRTRNDRAADSPGAASGTSRCLLDSEPCLGTCNVFGYCEQDLGWGPEVRVPAKTYVVTIPHPDFNIHSGTSVLVTFSSSFWIAKRETTLRDYLRCPTCAPIREMNTDKRRCSGCYPIDETQPDLPITVTRTQAAAFCAFTGRRLPTSAEWESAGHGPSDCTDPEKISHSRGVSTCNYRLFPWGDDEKEVCRLAHSSECEPKTGPRVVAPHPEGASPFGVEEMSGNVAEWIEDRVPEWLIIVDGEEWNVKGGDFFDYDGHDWQALALSQRHLASDTARFGIRCVRGGPSQVKYQIKERPGL